jgi:uncharacterized protein YqjF (DUF2071 family)
MKAPPPPRVARPVMYHYWRWLTFVHWRYPADTVQPLLPADLAVQTFDGSAWVGLVPFLMDGVRAPAVRALPWLSRFPETNVRTYVQDMRGRSGIWFLSLDAARLPAVLAARASYGLPYFWSDMSVRCAADGTADGAGYRYRCRRRWPGPAGSRCDAEVDVGPPLAESERDELAHFLTARHHLFTVIAGRLAVAEAEHPPWPLHSARLARLDQDLIQAAGLPEPERSPLLHASAGVPVRIGMWHW